MHTDNTCYFVGDTLWYKAYVVRADNLKPTDMSRILYVELLSPDGLLVERQNIIVSADGHTCGQFVLHDSLYSGYYELRAYTRWMLNFNHHQHRYDSRDRWAFFNRQMANDYYRVWDGLYSRVLPVYGKPDEPGDYDARRMYSRPKTRIEKAPSERLTVTFFPEGGHLVEGVESRVAFEAVDQYGEAQNVKGTLYDSDRQVGTISVSHMGRGRFSVTPSDNRLKAQFQWRGKDYSFTLPKAEKSGVVMTITDGKVTLQPKNLPTGSQYALSVMCRGTLKYFQPVDLSSSPVTLSLPLDSLSAGVYDVTLFDSDGQILADRLFFVKGGEADGVVKVLGNLKSNTTFSPYQQATVSVQLPEPNTTFSIAVRDAVTDEPTYDDGNLMTDLLLSSELKGFIAHPAYYFESDDATHRQNLDLLMMVQGWRKYNWKQLADTTFVPRYQPETTMTVSGAVYKMPGIPEVELDEVLGWKSGVGYKSRNDDTDQAVDDASADTEDTGVETLSTGGDVAALGLSDNYDEVGTNNKTIRNEVLVEAELILGSEIVGGVQKTENGHFLFQIPPFYGATFLNIKAYKESDSIRRAMSSRSDKTVFREDAYPDYYVKRDMPFPVYTNKYNFYQNHAPEWGPEPIEEDSLSELSMENDVHQLRNVNVKGHRRGKRAVDWHKPAFVRDAYDLYNDITDYGLSFGIFDMRQFPMQIARFLYGNMGRRVQYNVDGRLNERTYWRNYDPYDCIGGELGELAQASDNMRSSASIYENIKLSRLQDIRVFSDYEPRKEDSTMVSSVCEPDVTIEMVPIEYDGKQVVFRDRHIYFHGMNEPADFYQPDYSQRPVGERPADYRRTLYWNPNARADEDGQFTATFFNNGKETRIRISAAGVTPDGRLLFSK